MKKKLIPWNKQISKNPKFQDFDNYISKVLTRFITTQSR